MVDQTSTQHKAILGILDALLGDFGLSRADTKSQIVLAGEVPSIEETKSHDLLLSLAGALPSLANAIRNTIGTYSKTADPGIRSGIL